ncbi:hypothetical protein GCM10010124_18120 [Pilimelia terevasa]|uniref:DUF4230 domain-containing protein n=1 Tax=Pilimelia terevasa TaxID=53372 RepID=A0A8J3BP97_9ACTN|nr:hypothetical protein [Pilimelia terevasa]GGK25957.1 hypothetical protein GCM10010124_18120 [Pilimelia terevasa]
MRLAAALRRLDAWALPRLAAGLRGLMRRCRRARVPLSAGGLGLVLLLSFAVWQGGRPGSRAAAEPSARVGAGPGESVTGYLKASRAQLRALAAAAPAEEAYALVTLTAYLAPDRLPPLVGGLSVSAVFAKVPLPGVDTRVVKIDAFRVPEDVVAGMGQVALRFDGEVLDYQELLARAAGTDEKARRLRASYEAQRRVVGTEAAAMRAACSCVYALVVRAPHAVLARVATQPEVRIVDPAPEVRRLDRTVFLPPLPDQECGGGTSSGCVPKVPNTR